jgi:superfamily I DNA/RNA helicase
VDEFQDSSAIQWDIVKTIADGNQLFLFADDRQLVYRWRGASRERLAKVQKLRQPVIQFQLRGQHRYANNNSLGQFFRNLRSVLFENAEFRLSCPGSVHIKEYEYQGQMKAMMKGYVYKKLKQDNGEMNTIGVISRWPWDVEGLMEYLQRQGFYPRLISENVLQHEKNRQLLKVLSALYKGKSFLCDLVLLLSLFPGHQRLDWRLLESCCNGDYVDLECLEDHVSQRQMTFKLAQELNQISSRSIDNVFDLNLVLKSNFPTLHERIDLDDLHYELTVLETAISLNHSKTSKISKKDDLDICKGDIARRHIAMGQEVKPGINMLTVLQSKGKEFDHVILTDCRTDCFPDDQDGRNMFYVALTRAKKSVTIFKPNRHACVMFNIIQ